MMAGVCCVILSISRLPVNRHSLRELELERSVTLSVCSEMTLLIMLCIVKHLVWTGDMICGPERLIDSDEEPRELLWLGSRVVLVIRAISGGAT